jgi:nucleotide-binding universal stress UspA family protein
MFKKILLPTDGSQGVSKAINVAVGMATEFDAEVHVLTVIEPPTLVLFDAGLGQVLSGEKFMEELRKAAQRIVRDTKEIIEESGHEDVETAVLEGHTAETILEYAQKNKTDLIVMGTHGRRGLNRIILGSVAEEIVRRSPIPVLTVRMRNDGKTKKR